METLHPLTHKDESSIPLDVYPHAGKVSLNTKGDTLSTQSAGIKGKNGKNGCRESHQATGGARREGREDAP